MREYIERGEGSMNTYLLLNNLNKSWLQAWNEIVAVGIEMNWNTWEVKTK